MKGTELIHILRQRYLSCTHTSIYLILVQISRRSYIAYDYTELILITNLCSFGTPVGVIEFILVFQILSGYYGAYTCISDFICVLQNLYMYYRS